MNCTLTHPPKYIHIHSPTHTHTHTHTHTQTHTPFTEPHPHTQAIEHESHTHTHTHTDTHSLSGTPPRYAGYRAAITHTLREYCLANLCVHRKNDLYCGIK